MKFWGALVLVAAAGCASVERSLPGPAAGAIPEGREYVDRLRVDTGWRPAPTGGQRVTCWVELPHGSYIAQGWGWADACCTERPLYQRARCVD